MRLALSLPRGMTLSLTLTLALTLALTQTRRLLLTLALTLALIEADSSLASSSKYPIASWPLELDAVQERRFRYFRVLQWGPNAHGDRNLMLGGIELYGSLFESVTTELREHSVLQVAPMACLAPPMVCLLQPALP